jgi:hypothetical protein
MRHCGFHGDPDWVSRYLPIWLGSEGGAHSVQVTDAAAAGHLLSHCVWGRGKNGIRVLYAELLAARLNLASGASPEAIADVLVSIDAFLATPTLQGRCDRDGSGHSQVSHWIDTLRKWNRGDIGPGACPE